MIHSNDYDVRHRYSYSDPDYDYRVVETLWEELYFFVIMDGKWVFGAKLEPEEIKPAIADFKNYNNFKGNTKNPKTLYNKITKFSNTYNLIANKNGTYENLFGVSACKAFETLSWCGFGDFRKK